MLLHNKKSVPIEWEALGKKYQWEPFGSCDVPDFLFEHIKLEGLPVDVSPVPPKAKADAAFEAEQAAARSDELKALKKKLELSNAELVEAKKAISSADERATKATEALLAAEDRCSVLESQLAQAKSDAEEFERLAASAMADAEKAQEAGQRQQAEQKQSRQSRK